MIIILFVKLKMKANARQVQKHFKKVSVHAITIYINIQKKMLLLRGFLVLRLLSLVMDDQ